MFVNAFSQQSNLDEAAYHQLQSIERPTLRQRHLTRILERPESDHRRQRALAEMESRTRDHFDLGTGPIDWSTMQLDWGAILKFIISILPLILALFGL